MPQDKMMNSLMKGMDRRLKILESSVKSVAKNVTNKKKKSDVERSSALKNQAKEAKGFTDALANREIKELRKSTNAILGALSSMSRNSIPSPS